MAWICGTCHHEVPGENDLACPRCHPEPAPAERDPAVAAQLPAVALAAAVRVAPPGERARSTVARAAAFLVFLDAPRAFPPVPPGDDERRPA